jgi:glycosyltransferase involved in cell wall biosynthesis
MHGIPLFLDIEDWELGWYFDAPPLDALKHLAHIERANGFLWTWLSELLTRRADEVFVVNRALQRRFGGTLLIHGADTNEFDPGRWEPREARRRIGLPDGRYIIFTGSPSPAKGLDDLLDAVRRLNRPEVRVLIVGSFRHNPAYEQSLLSRYGNRVILFDSRPHSEMPAFLAAGELVALPQRVNRTTMNQVPGKVFEAMAMAKPILATAVSDLPEILGGVGRLIAPGSVAALTDELRCLLSRPDEAKELGRKARLRCQECYSWDAMERIFAERLERWQPLYRATRRINAPERTSVGEYHLRRKQ